MEFSIGLALNFGAGQRRCFDSASVSETAMAAVLCDGANGTPNGGLVAKDTARYVIDDLNEALPLTDARLQQISTLLDERYSDSGSTLVAVFVQSSVLHLVGVGDSYASLFKHSSEDGWQHDQSMERHLTQLGHPSQLIGAEVPILANRIERALSTPQNDYATFLMSDGCGSFVSTDDLLSIVREIGERTPSADELNFFAYELAHLALTRGSQDDVSVLISWLKVRP